MEGRSHRALEHARTPDDKGQKAMQTHRNLALGLARIWDTGQGGTEQAIRESSYHWETGYVEPVSKLTEQIRK